jgi:hypothetical protein
MVDQNTFRTPSLSPDRRRLLVNELWEGIRTILEEIDLDAVQKSELILELGKYNAPDAGVAGERAAGVSLRALSAKAGNVDGLTDDDAIVDGALNPYRLD